VLSIDQLLDTVLHKPSMRRIWNCVVLEFVLFFLIVLDLSAPLSSAFPYSMLREAWSLVGRTPFVLTGLGLLSLLISLAIKWRKQGRAAARDHLSKHLLESLLPAAFALALIFLYNILIAVPHRIRTDADSMDHPPTYIAKLSPPQNLCIISPGECAPAKSPTEEKPDISIRLVYPTAPAVYFINSSNVILRDYKYWFAIVDLTKSQPAKMDALQIPSANGDWIRPRDKAGPMDIFSRVASSMQAGDRLTGYIGVTCPKCKKTRRFWVDIRWQEGGWYSELTDAEVKALDSPTAVPQQFPYGIPVARRKPIGMRAD
jgi:hypothetical protein